MAKKSNNIRQFSLEYHHRHDRTLQFWWADGSGDEEEEEQLIKVEAMSNDVSDKSGDGGVSMGTFVSIYVKGKTELHPDGNTEGKISSKDNHKNQRNCSFKNMYKCSTEPILVYRENFSNEPKFDKYLNGIKSIL